MSHGCYPAACGALGRYEHRQVERIANALGQGMSAMHEDNRSILLLDREPLCWQHGSEHGLAWSEGISHPGAITSWRDAARRLAACGLVVGRRRRYLHSSVAGIAPIYYRDDGRATYFATRIDPLVQACDEKLTIDWKAWAAIFIHTTPIGDRTPFLEVRRLRPFSVLEHRRWGGLRQTVNEWPWAQPEADAREAVAELLVDHLREAIGILPAGPVTCPLSGGWDSRLLLALLRERDDLELSALTLKRTHAGHPEEKYARAVASAASVPWAEVPAREGRFWDEAEEVALRTDFQTTHHGWYMPLARGLRRRQGPAIDGLAGGIFLKGFLLNERMLAAPSRQRAISMLWDRASTAPRADEVLSERLAAVFSDLAWRQWLAEAEAVAAHPAFLSLTGYLTRTVRGISLAPVALLGADARMVTPYTDERVAKTALSLSPSSKVSGEVYRRIFEIVNPALGSLPSSHDPLPKGKSATPPKPTKEEVEGYRRYLEQSPMRDALKQAAFERTGPLTIRSKTTHIMRALAVLGMWHERYRRGLREIDVRDVLG